MFRMITGSLKPILAMVGVLIAVNVHAQDTNPDFVSLTTVQCPHFDDLKAHYRHAFIEPIAAWSKTELADAKARPVLYLFSGPDAVTALALFPNAAHLTLVADQIPEYQLLEKGEKGTEAAERRECEMLNSFAYLGFYKTNELNGKDGARPRFIKLLTYSIGFAGANIVNVEVLTFSPTGELVSEGTEFKIKPVGLRFNAVRDDGLAVTIDYLTINLSNPGLKAHPMSADFLKANLSDVLFLKSASHLLQNPSFSTLAEMIRQSPPPLVVQDETGLSVKELHDLYSVTLYGQFTDPQRIWAHSPEARAFIEEYATHPSKGSLPFRIGYEKKAGSALIVGRKAAASAPTASPQNAPRPH